MKNYAWRLGCCYMTPWSRNSEGTVAVMPLKWQASRVTDRQTDRQTDTLLLVTAPQSTDRNHISNNTII